jgi:uncharacterized protein (DUF2235 family)
MGRIKRRILFFFDGSNNKAAARADVHQTNVFRLRKTFTGGDSAPQIMFYFAGVGTRGDPISAISGRGFDQIIIEAFVNLTSNYSPGDQIYLFGFSRGAAAARALSGMISDPGLLPSDELSLFPELWRYFVGAGELGRADCDVLREKLRSRVIHPTIRFIGAFDTVAGSSWDSQKLFSKVRFRSLHLNNCVSAAVQILAIDDNRNPSFSPLLWNRSTSNQVLEQIWMPGVHSDIGGSSDGRLLGNVALLTMIARIKEYCPELEWNEGAIAEILEDLKERPIAEITNERAGLFPKLLLKGHRSIGLHKNEFIHSIFDSLVDREFKIRGARQSYKPTNINSNLPRLNTQFDSEFSQICRRHLD